MNETPEERYNRIHPDIPLDLMEDKPVGKIPENLSKYLSFLVCLLFGVIIGLMV